MKDVSPALSGGEGVEPYFLTDHHAGCFLERINKIPPTLLHYKGSGGFKRSRSIRLSNLLVSNKKGRFMPLDRTCSPLLKSGMRMG